MEPHGGWHGKGRVDEVAMQRAFDKGYFQRYLNLVPRKYQVGFGTTTLFLAASAVTYYMYRCKHTYEERDAGD